MRRDVVAFEHNCGPFDPDAVAAFKSLLTAKAAPAPAPKAAPPPVKNAASEPVHRPEPVKQPAAKPEAKPAVAESEPARHGAEVSDANWLAAVRGALVTHDHVPPRAEPAPPVHAAVPPVHAAVPSEPAPSEARSAPVNLAPPAPELAPVPAAPALPPAASVAAAPAPKVDSSHPVPPGSIPEAAPASEATARPEPRSRWRALLTHVPGFNRGWSRTKAGLDGRAQTATLVRKLSTSPRISVAISSTDSQAIRTLCAERCVSVVAPATSLSTVTISFVPSAAPTTFCEISPVAALCCCTDCETAAV